MINPRAGAKRAKTRKQRLREVYHSKVLPDIARQCPIRQPDSDEPFAFDVAVAAWKEHFRGLFHRGRSTEDLSEDEYAALIQQVEAHVCMEYGVEFHESVRGAH